MVLPVNPRRPLRRRSLLHDTIMTAGPGGAKNPLPGSPAAKENEIRRKLTGDTLLTNANILQPEQRPSPDQQDRLRIDIDKPRNAILATGTDGKRANNKKTITDTKNAPDSSGLESASRKPRTEIERLGLIEKNFPIDRPFMRREGRTQIITEVAEILDGKRKGFSGEVDIPGVGKGVHVGGHFLKRDIANFTVRAIRVKDKEEILELMEEIRDPDDPLLKLETSKSWAETQTRAFLGLLGDSLIHGPISKEMNPQELRRRLGKTLESLDERAAMRRQIDPTVGSLMRAIRNEDDDPDDDDGREFPLDK